MTGTQSGNCSLELSIPESEFRERASRIREFVVSEGLGVLVVFSASRSHIWHQTGHVGYISNWSNRDRIADTIVVIPAEGEPVFLIAGLPVMAEQVRESSWLKDVRVVAAPDPRAPALPSVTKSFGGEVREILAERGMAGKKVGLVGVEAMPVPIYRSIEAELPGSSIAFADDIVGELRSRKSPAEIALMKEAARLSDLGFQTLLETAKPGMWGYEVVAEMTRAMRAQGADYADFWLASGPSDGWSIRMASLKPNRRELQQGDQVSCCSYAVYEGYWAHAMRTGTLAGRSPQQERIFEPCLEVHRAGIEAMKPGVPISKVVETVRRTAEKRGMTLHSPRIGHGMGLDYGERPYVNEGNTEALQPGMVAVIHTQLVVPGGDFYVPLGDICHVTDDGVELLTKFPQEAFRA